MNLVDLVIDDPWKGLRKDLYRNVEPEVVLEFIMKPVDSNSKITPEEIPAYCARMSHGSSGEREDNLRLNRKLIEIGHDTPLEFFDTIYKITGLSKSCMTQYDRHRIGVGFVQMSGRFIDRSKNGFVYNTYDNLKDEDVVRKLLEKDSEHNRKCMEGYEYRRGRGATKQDSRKVLPVSFATGTYVHMNARSLRHLFDLRLDKSAEWEIRRMTAMIIEEVMPYGNSLFEDQYNRFLEMHSK